MAISFAKTAGAAQKNDGYKYKDGEQTLRIFGGVMPKYTYWLKGTNNKDIPLECLSFDRDLEKFTNAEVDHVQSKFPELKCAWAYEIMCLDPTDGKTKILHLKKKLFGQIMDARADLGDPTDLDTGWDINFKKTKTGPAAFNVEYTLNVLRCKVRALSEGERAVIAASKTIDELIPRLTAEDQLVLINKIKNGTSEDNKTGTPTAGDVPEEAADL